MRHVRVIEAARVVVVKLFGEVLEGSVSVVRPVEKGGSATDVVGGEVS